MRSARPRSRRRGSAANWPGSTVSATRLRHPTITAPSPTKRREHSSQEDSMTLRWRTSATAATLAACALLAAGCGRAAPGTSSNSNGGGSGQISPTKGLVDLPRRRAPRASPSATWAVYRPVNSLDPIFAFDYPENTAISLMCESLLLQEPDGSIQPGLATVATPTPTSMVFTLRPGVTFWDGARGHRGGRGLQPRAPDEPGFRRLLRPGLQPGEVDRGDRSRPGDHLAQAARLLAGGRAVLDGRHHHGEELRHQAGQELRDAGRRHHVHRRRTSSSPGPRAPASPRW